MTPPLTTTPADLLREAAAGWEPGPGPFTVPLPVVNKIVNYLAAQPAPPTEAVRLLRAAIGIIEAADHRASAADGPVGHVRDEMTDSEWRALYETLIEARRYLAATEEGTP